jgi:hypothetical protein
MKTNINAAIKDAIDEEVLVLNFIGKYILNPFYVIHTAYVNNKHDVIVYEMRNGFSCAIIKERKINCVKSNFGINLGM